MIQFNIDELIKQYGPSVVAASQRQVAVALAQDILWCLFGVALLAFAAWGTRREVRYWTDPERPDYGNKDDHYMVLAVFVLASAILGFILVASAGGEAWTYAANPEYATLKVLRGLVGK